MGFPGVFVLTFPPLVFRTVLTLSLMKETAVSIVNVMRGRGWENPSSSRDYSESAPRLEVEQGSVFGLTLESDKVLPDQIRDGLPVVLFCETSHQFSTEKDDEGLQCSVCLCNFTEEDKVRQTPRCSHIFHKDCLDRWLDHCQTTCPLCRSSLVSDDLLTKQERMVDTELVSDFTVWWASYQSAGRTNWWQAYCGGIQNLIHFGH